MVGPATGWQLSIPILAVVLAVLSLIGVPRAEAAIFGLVIGIDLYAPPTRPLEGAVNDALDITAALQEVGAVRVITLLNSDATREAVEGAWRQLVDEAEAGDTIVMSFAGHGAREPERIAGDEVDGHDEVQLLAGFAPEGPGTRERLIDNETYAWFSDASERGIIVLYVNDSCHSGTAVRTVARGRYRLVEEYTINADELVLNLAPEPHIDAGGINGVTYLGAGQDDQRIPEIAIRDYSGVTRLRGALSFAFAEMLRRASHDGTQEIRRRDLRAEIVPEVLQRADGRQTPSLLPAIGSDDVVLRLDVPDGTETEIPLSGLPLLALTELRNRPIPEGLIGIRDLDNVSDDSAVPDLTWDAECERIASPAGDWSGGAVQENLQGFVDKWRLLYALMDRAAGQPVPIEVSVEGQLHPNGRHPAGTHLDVAIGPFGHPFLTMILLSRDGSAMLAYPDIGLGDTLAIRPEDRLGIGFEVAPPFGEEHLVVIASASPLNDVHTLLSSAQPGGWTAGAISNPLLEALDATGSRLGIAGMFTGDPAECSAG